MDPTVTSLIKRVLTYGLLGFIIISIISINWVYKIINIYVFIAFCGFLFVCYLSYKAMEESPDQDLPSNYRKILTPEDARTEINNYLSKDNNFKKMINWEQRDGFHSGVKRVHENGEDRHYYGVIANLFNDFGKPLPEKIRIVWSLDDNMESKVDIIDRNEIGIDPFFDFTSYQIVGGYKKSEPAPNTIINLRGHENQHKNDDFKDVNTQGDGKN